VLSKADQVDEDRRHELALRHPRAVLVSAHTGEGLEALVHRVEVEFARRLQDVELLIPYAEGSRLAELHEVSGDLEREETSEGVRIRARLPATVAARYAQFALGPRVRAG
jgi:GTP-binding protein HflX